MTDRAIRILGICTTITLLLVVTPGGRTALAQEAEEHSSTDEGSGGGGRYWQDHFSLHGFLTLGYAELDVAVPGDRSADEVVLGLEEDGSFPYGNGALNLRYDFAAKHSLILQLAVSDLGDSPLDGVGGDLELDWLFYQWQLGTKTQLRLGRQPAPVGIFNELRDVGVILPFFRPSFVFYREGSIFSETIDGVGLSHRFSAEKPWSLDADLYYGEFEVLEQGTAINEDIERVDATNALGGQLWLNTPVEGLRVGLGGLQWDVGDESGFSREEETWTSWYASLDGVFEHFVVRSEYRRVDFGLISVADGQELDVALDNYYWQIGWLVTEKLRAFLQGEYFDIGQSSDFYVDGRTRSRGRQDTGAVVSYDFRPDLILKVEYHEVENDVSRGNEIVFGPGGVRVRPIYERIESDYSIVSLAMSF